MPGQDRTGPSGQGSRTGKAQGKCKPAPIKKDSDETISEENLNYRNSVIQSDDQLQLNQQGRGQGRGLGRGRGKNSAGKGFGQRDGRGRQ